MADEDGMQRRVTALEDGQKELGETMHKLGSSQVLMQRDVLQISKDIGELVSSHKAGVAARSSRTLTPEKIIGLVFGSTVFVGSCLAGLIWFIHTIVDPVDTRAIAKGAEIVNTLDGLSKAVADRFNSQTTQLNSRLDTFQDSIRSIREGDQGQGKDIGEVRITVGKQEDRMAAMEGRWASFDLHDYAGENARQNAIISVNSARLDRVEAKQEDRIRRELETLAKDRDRERERADLTKLH